ncbi:MAG: four helix bundle protein [Prevotellaceae bacterium]|jgi:four helix bundle protein|nr:four helix bundle protein [Prevotellaceae bacterium]
MKKTSILKEKSFAFAVRIVKLSEFIQEKKIFVLNNQILRSGTAIGALIYEAEYAQSNADFINKFSIALKETNETMYWLSLLEATNYIDTNLYESLNVDCNELISMLVATIKTLKNK